MNHGRDTHNRRKHGSRAGLKRPKRPLSFQWSAGQIEAPVPTAKTSSSPSSQPVATPRYGAPLSTASAFEKRVLLLDLIIRRNKNQHRNQLFFKHLRLLRSSLTRLLDISNRLANLSQKTSPSAPSSESIRRMFEAEASLRSQREIVEERVRDVLVPQCYISFSGLVQDSQFANLGIVLVALLSEIALGEDGVGRVKLVSSRQENRVAPTQDENVESDGRARSPWSRSLLGKSTRVTGEDQGEVVERVYNYNEPSKEEMTTAGLTGQPRASTPATGKVFQLRTPGTLHKDRNEHLVRANLATENTISPEKVEHNYNRDIFHDKAEDQAKRKSKGKKPKSAIDDLFSGLL